MSDDISILRNLVKSWQLAVENGEIDKIKDFMSDDVVYLTPGQPAIRGKQTFINSQNEMLKSIRIQPTSEIKEIQVNGDLAYMWQDMKVSVIPNDGGKSFHLSGPVLSIFRKLPDGNWVLSRDANMITPAHQ